MSKSPTQPSDVELEMSELEYKARRHQESLEGLRKHARYLDEQIEHHAAELAKANEAVDALPDDAGPAEILAAKTAQNGVEYNLGQLLEQKIALHSEIDDELARTAVDAKLLAEARAES